MAQITLNSSGVASNGSLVLQSNGTTTAVTVDTAQNVGIGVTPSAWFSTYKALQVGAVTSLFNDGGTTSRLSNNAIVNAGGNIAYISTAAASYYQQSAGTHAWFNAASGTAGNTITATQAMTLNASGNLLVGRTSGTTNIIAITSGSQGTAILGITDNGTQQGAASFFNCTNGGENAAGCAMTVKANSSTSRSINAGGTINASGADYAEYMAKSGDFTVAKGDVVGINAQGKLTNVFTEAVSFVVKSTNPSYVGGDTWGNENSIGAKPEEPAQFPATENTEAETDEAFAIRYAQYQTDIAAFEVVLEAARALVDRIAFSGQVPVNVTGATAGQYIIPVSNNGAIKGQAISNPTFEQYQSAVGKVIAIEADGRARIIVKVA